MTRITRFLIPLSWALWSIVFLVLVWAFVESLFDKTHSPEVSHGLGALVTGFLLLAFIGVGLCLYVATRRRSTVWLVVFTLLLAYIVFMLIAIPSVKAFKSWRFEAEAASTSSTQ
jgi:membrane protein YdbS with pleckstrin-like domain